MERVARSSNRRHWLVQVGDALFLDEFPRCAGLSLLGIGGSRATFIAPGDSALVWKLTSVEDEPNRMAPSSSWGPTFQVFSLPERGWLEMAFWT